MGKKNKWKKASANGNGKIEIEEVKPRNKLAIILPWELERQIVAAAWAVKGEIAGWADAEVDEEMREITITRIAIPEQKASGAHAEVSAQQTFDLIKAGELDVTKGIVSWHSHVDFAAEPSDVDKRFFWSMAAQMPVFVGIVMNRKGQWTPNVWCKTRFGAYLLESEMLFEPAPEPESVELYEKLAKERVKEPWENNKNERRYVYQRKDGVYTWYNYETKEQVILEEKDLLPTDDVHRYADQKWGVKELKWMRHGVTCWKNKSSFHCDANECPQKECTYDVQFEGYPGLKSYCDEHMEEIEDILKDPKHVGTNAEALFWVRTLVGLGGRPFGI